MPPTQQLYLCIFRDGQGEKIAEKVSVRAPKVGEIIPISYLDAQGNFEVVREIQRTPTKEYEIVSLEVKPVDYKGPGSWIYSKIKTLYMLFQFEQ
jgi:hypothetical protein